MNRYRALPERVTVFGGAYGGTKLSVSRDPLPDGPRAHGSEDSEYVRADLHAGSVAALREIATRPVVERNPDGDDQAAHTMQMIAREALAALGGQ
jgi:hypothetical protein